MYFNIVSQNEEERSATLAGLLSDGYRMSSGAGAVDRINHFYPFASYPDITITWGKDTPIKIIYLCDEGGYRVTFSEFLKLGKLSVISNMGGNKSYNAHLYKDKVGLGCQLFDSQKILALAEEIEKRMAK